LQVASSGLPQHHDGTAAIGQTTIARAATGRITIGQASEQGRSSAWGAGHLAFNGFTILSPLSFPNP
jgi:hypothetical protein